MQMYLAAPFVILLLWRRPKLAVTLMGVVLLALAPLRYLVILRWRLSTFIYHGIT
jgi:peptidoglycan/LPS O-acetylase OafA/YrhL